MSQVASFTDAWIETLPSIMRLPTTVASFTDAWIETKKKVTFKEHVTGRIFYRCVD